MKKILILHLCLHVILGISYAQNTFYVHFNDNSGYAFCDNTLPTQSPVKPPLHEMRAVWLTTIGGIDWPHSYSQSEISARKQQKELCDILDQLVSAGFNTVLLQTRIRATTIFPSDMEPWDGCLSGFPTKSPGYDALAFAIDECHKRGMKLHAWIVSIPVGKWNGTGCKALRKTYPELIKKIGDEGFMNPEASGTATYLARFCKDVTERYDIDGIHLDYIRYPETWKVIKNKDAGRQNITRIVKTVHDAVKASKPWVMMSCSPVGKYADTKRMWSHGWNARDAVCQDAAQWLKDGIMDALFPMMYFRDSNFYPFAIDWQERSAGRIVTPGLGIYFMHPREKNWPLEDITREMHVLRQYGMGTCFFRSKFFTDNTKGLYEYTQSTYSPQPSLQPVMKWYDTEEPSMPSALELTETEDGDVILSWQGNDSQLQYNIYGSDSFPVNTDEADNLLASNIIDKKVLMKASSTIRYFAVTATDRYGNESKPAQWPSVEAGQSSSDNSVRSMKRTLLPYDGKHVYLDGTDVTEGQLIVVSSLQGNVLLSRFAKKDRGRLCIEIDKIAMGHYLLHLINKKGHRHLIGQFSQADK